MKTIELSNKAPDEVLAEIWRHKRAISEEHGHDVRSIARDLQRRQLGHTNLVRVAVPIADKRS